MFKSFLFLLIFSFSSAIFAQHTKTFVIDSFKFEPGQLLKSSAGPSEWTLGEISQIQKLLGTIYEKSPKLFQKMNKKANTFYRYKTGMNGQIWAGWFNSRDLSINVSDYFFKNDLPPDPISGVSTAELILTHDLMHSVEIGAEFYSVVGWPLVPPKSSLSLKI